MSAVCILAPVIIGSWPVLVSAVAGALTGMGFSTVKDMQKTLQDVQKKCKSVKLQVENSQVVTENLNLDQRLLFQRQDITVEFFRDARGTCGVNVYGSSHSKEELTALGQEVSQHIVQNYVYNRLMTEFKARGYNVVEEKMEENRTIHIRVRKWEG